MKVVFTVATFNHEIYEALTKLPLIPRIGEYVDIFVGKKYEILVHAKVTRVHWLIDHNKHYDFELNSHHVEITVDETEEDYA